MSPLFRPFQTLFGSARIASRLSSGQTVRIERVKIKKGKPATRFLRNVIKGAVVLQLVLWATSPAPADKDKHKEGRRHKEGESRFIAFPLTTKEYPGRYYAQSDPEWLEFVRISKDQKAKDEIKGRWLLDCYAAHYVLKCAATSPMIPWGADRNIRVSRYWVDIDYPLKAPPVFERSGILVTEDSLEWTTMPCEPVMKQFLDRILWPMPVALGFWAFGTETVKQTALGVARYFGFGSETPSSAQSRPNPGARPPLPTSPGPEVQQALQRIRQETTKRPEEVNGRGSMSSSAGAPPATPSTSSRDKAVGVSNKPAVDQNDQAAPREKSWIHEWRLPITTSTQPWRKFKETYARQRRPFRHQPDRGNICLSGLVELETAKAFVVAEVIMWYDPKTKSHLPGASRAIIRSVRHKVQQARG
ncbi:hypothetical protein C8A00DRAFT_44278 [Chaetomidium leptoderma]|uniref:Uncharacterized protein n=1 Tax=Chaetomidium leptoderma TaxID=669021 RepID=A0AAN6ZXP8_9PEZI|nr:hypothetical protein C8A00DRAFT_44278 [Chaetomidium leptoderma]